MNFDQIIFKNKKWQSLSKSARLMLFYLISRADTKSICNPSIKEIVTDLTLDRKTAIKAISELITLKIISAVKQKGERSIYNILLKFDTEQSPEQSPQLELKLPQNKHKTNIEPKKPSPYHHLSELLLSKIKEMGSEGVFKESVINKWDDTFRLMIERDSRTEQQIIEKIDNVFDDPFWSKNIRSADKLRVQWNDGKLDRLTRSEKTNNEIVPPYHRKLEL